MEPVTNKPTNTKSASNLKAVGTGNREKPCELAIRIEPASLIMLARQSICFRFDADLGFLLTRGRKGQSSPSGRR